MNITEARQKAIADLEKAADRLMEEYDESGDYHLTHLPQAAKEIRKAVFHLKAHDPVMHVTDLLRVVLLTFSGSVPKMNVPVLSDNAQYVQALVAKTIERLVRAEYESSQKTIAGSD